MTKAQRQQRRRSGRRAAVAGAPQEFGSVGRAVTAHTALNEPLITVEGLDAVLTPLEAVSLTEQLIAACVEICARRPDVAGRDRLEAAIRGTDREESYRQRLREFVEAVEPVLVDTHAHTPYRFGVMKAMERLRAEQEFLSAESGPADAAALAQGASR